jgi:preprotein translocase subunit SecD
VRVSLTALRQASPRQLSDDREQLIHRLLAFGGTQDTLSVQGQSIVVTETHPLPVAISTLIAPGVLQLRPALCQAVAYSPPSGGTAGPLPGHCSAPQYSLQAPTLIVNTGNGGISNISSIPPDPALSGQPTTSAADNDADPRSPVLIPLVGGGGLRYLLGPSELGGSAIASAAAAYQKPQWVVDATLSGAGSSLWDALSEKYFHEIIGIDLDGRLVSAPLTQPTQESFTSFDGKVQISGDFTQRSATALAAELDSRPLVVPLRVSR